MTDNPMTDTKPKRTTKEVLGPDKDHFLGEENPFEAMMSRFDVAAKLLSLDPGLYKVLRNPQTQIIVSLPFLNDSATTEIYTPEIHEAVPVFPKRSAPGTEKE